jgi:hypothetical protein
MSKLLKVYLPAGEIPLDSTVIKRGGEKRYTIRDTITIYGPEKGQRQEIKSQDGALFLTHGTDGGINAISKTTELLWVVDRQEFRAWLVMKESEEEGK